jgi:ATP-dependent Clp protease ATP-binding subunit ClpB
VLIARAGYDPVYGARPLRRFIQRDVETRIGRALLSGEIHDGATITIDAAGDELLISWTNPPGGSDEEGEEAAAPEEAVEAHA